MKSNKNGVKLLAAVAIFAMLFAGVAVFTSVDDVDAAPSEGIVYVDSSKAEATDANGSTEKPYATLEKAINANKATIMLKSAYTTSTITIPTGVTLDTNGYVLTINGDLTINGTLKIADRAKIQEGTSFNSIILSASSQINMNNVNYLGSSAVHLQDVDANNKAVATVTDLVNPHGFTVTVSSGKVDLKGSYVSVGDQTNITIGKGVTATINYGSGTAANTGTITVDGSLVVTTAVNNSGTITVNGSISGVGAITNSGTINLNGTYDGTSVITNSGTVNLANLQDNSNALSLVKSGYISNTTVGSNNGKVAGTGWEYGVSGALTLNNYNGKQYFDGAISTITATGTNVITISAESASVSAIKSSAELTIQGDKLTVNYTNVATTDFPTAILGSAKITITGLELTVYANATSSTGYSKNTHGIEAVTDLDILSNSVVKVFAGNKALWIHNNIKIVNSTVTAGAYEKAVRTGNNGSIDIDGTSTLNAVLLNGAGINDNGADDRFGIKTGTIAIKADSIIKTQGLRYLGSISTSNMDTFNAAFAGKIYVYGDYTQFYKDESSIMTAGLVFNNVTGSVPVKVVDGESDAAAGFNILDGTATYGAVTLNIDGTTVKETMQTGNTPNFADSQKVIMTSGNVTTTLSGSNTLVITPGASLASATVTEKAKLEVQAIGSNLLNITIAVGDQDVKFESFKGIVELSVGSTVANVVLWESGNIVLSDKDVLKISGSEKAIVGNVTIAGPSSGTATILVEEGKTLSIESGAKLNITGNVKMNNDGQIVGGGEIVVNSPAQFYTANPVSVTFSGDGRIILEDAIETLKLSDKLASSITAEPTQKVIITGNLTIKENQYLIVNGDLEIPEGVTVTIENGGRLILRSPTASATIAGTIKSLGQYNSTTAGFTVESSVTKDVVITGSIIAGKTNEGDFSVDIKGYAYLEGTVTVNAKAIASFGKLNVAEEGTVTVKGTIAGTIYNQGTVTIDGAVDATTGAQVRNQSTSAIVQIDSISRGVLTISDEGLYLKTIDTERYYVPCTVASLEWQTVINSISFQNVKGITVTESIEYEYNSNGDRNPVNHMNIAGTVTVSNTKDLPIETPIVTVATGKVCVVDELTITKAAVSVAADATLYVEGTVYVDDSDMPTGVSGSRGITGSGTVTVSGLVRVVELEFHEGSLKVNAVLYEQKIDTKDIYYYTNLADAIASGEKELEVLGTQLKVAKDTTIPAGIDIDASGAEVIVLTDVTLTVADGGYLAFNQVTVYGTFYIENTDDGVNKTTNIISDTSVITETTAMYTNLLNALNSAESGEVKITRGGDQTVVLASDATVKEGVTLTVPTSKTLKIKNGVTLTVEGTLDLKGTLGSVKADNATTDNEFNTEYVFVDNPTKLFSVVKVTGTLVAAAPMSYADYSIPGAYYELKGKYYITTIDQAAAVIKTVDSAKVDIYGVNKVGAVAFEGTSMIPAVVNVHGNITAEALTVRFGTITVDTDVCIDGTFGSSVGTVALSNMKVGATALIITDNTVTVDDKEVQKVSMKGTVATNKNTSSASVKFSGAVEINGLFSMNTTYSGGSGTNAVNEDAVVTVVNGGELRSAKVLTVNGNLIAQNGGKVTATTLVVNATLDIKEKSDSMPNAGVIEVTNLYIGGTTSDVSVVSLGASAAVNAPSSGVSVVYLFPGSTVTGGLSIALAKEDVKYTEFYVEDVLWLTVYNLSTESLKIVKADGTYNFVPKTIKEKEFESWQYTSSGKLYDVGSTKVIGDYSKVYADIEYKVYSIGVYACEGIDDVFIDGSIMVYSTINTENGYTGMFNAMVTAGEHTISYTLTNGYSGTAIMSVNGDKVTGFKFTAGGDFGASPDYTITLQGIEKSGYVPDTPEPTPVEPTEKDDSLGITEYLLIVLVVLAAILVVVVAIRMMRS